LGAVIGREFSYELLHAIHPAPEDQLQTALKAVTDAELLYVRGIPPEALYWFKRALIQDAAYERSPLPRAVQNRPPRRLFRSSLAELQTEKDSLAEKGGFEPSRPFISYMLPRSHAHFLSPRENPFEHIYWRAGALPKASRAPAWRKQLVVLKIHPRGPTAG
jgi:hypothetical protein